MTRQERERDFGVYLRLFPLNLVLYPGMRLPLHIFEDRYKTMIGECLREEQPFGVLLIKRGREVGGFAEVHPVGTTARIEQSIPLPDGRMNLMTIGEQRFRILQMEQHAPYMSARVALLPLPKASQPAKRLDAMASRLSAAFAEFDRLMAHVDANWSRREDLPDAATEIVYRIAASLPIPDGEKQRLLTEDDLETLMTNEYDILEAQRIRLRGLIAVRKRLEQRVAQFGDMPQPFHLN